MAKKLILIGEGDDRVEEWFDEFYAPMNMISDTLKKMAKHGVRIKWNLVIPKDENWRELKRSNLRRATPEMLIETLEGVHMEYEHWGGDMPGRSGCWIRVLVELHKRKKNLGLLTEAAESLNCQWAKSKAAAAEHQVDTRVSKAIPPQLEFWDILRNAP